ncbi:uncharacterized protein LOC141691146 [Apium graveolens]|uniref:uncharacterized protein LOC141691146 n=1 Tax=Apium graveolens TaxID=4045 RepID=UPI003D7AF1F1
MQFVSSRRFEKTTSDLYKVYQKYREPLRDYLTRFNREKVTITNCDTPTAIEAFRRSLERESPLYEELTKYPCKSMDDVQAKAMAQIRLEEDKREDEDKKVTTPRQREHKPDYKPYTRGVRDEHLVNSLQGCIADWRKDPSLPPTYDSYGFSVTPTVLVKEFEKLGNADRWPPKTSKPRTNPDSKLWCEFHGDYGHRAKDCIALRKEIDVLIKKGYLTEYMSTHATNNVRNNVTPSKLLPPPPHHKVINYIVGGSEVCGSTYSQAKRMTIETGTRVSRAYVSPTSSHMLQFDESYMEHVKRPQHNSLVISLRVENCLIKRILVDNGSAVNIMIFDTLCQMGLTEGDMEKKHTTLVGFSGETNKIIGEIHLPTYAGGINLLQKFLIIDGGSTYNIILGRAWIHDMCVVPSTLHQVIKFSTPWGVQKIRGDQAMARECYHTRMKPTV